MKALSVAFRADASTEIGTGHVMRCLALADAVRAGGGHCVFLARHLPAHLRSLLEERGHAWRLLDQAAQPYERSLAHAAWLGTSQQHDARQCAAALAGQTYDWIVADHYALDDEWEQAMQGSAGRLMAIDDLADRRHACALLLDQNLYGDAGERYAGLTPPGCTQLIGPRYALLRPEFAALRAHGGVRDGRVRSILVFFGGVDRDNLTGLALQALSGALAPGVGVEVVIGQQHPARAALETVCAQAGYRLHVQTSRMAELMARADLAIGAGGSASWERCSLGLPAVLVSLADNQVAIADALHHGGAAVHVGAAAALDRHTLRGAVVALLADPEALRRMSAAAHALADGGGVERVLNAMREAA